MAPLAMLVEGIGPEVSSDRANHLQVMLVVANPSFRCADGEG